MITTPADAPRPAIGVETLPTGEVIKVLASLGRGVFLLGMTVKKRPTVGRPQREDTPHAERNARFHAGTP